MITKAIPKTYTMLPKMLLLLLLVAGTSATTFAQTKKIAHRSHSGKAATFTIDGRDNFGLGEEQKKQMEMARKAKSDSIRMKQKADSLSRQPKKDTLSPPVTRTKRKRQGSTKITTGNK